MDKEIIRQNDYWGVRVTHQDRVSDSVYFVEVYDRDSFNVPDWTVHVACHYTRQEDKQNALYDALLDMGWIMANKSYDKQNRPVVPFTT